LTETETSTSTEVGGGVTLGGGVVAGGLTGAGGVGAGVTATGALAALFENTWSVSFSDTLTASANPDPGATAPSTEAVTVTVAEPPLAIDPSEQLIPDVVEHEPCDGDADTTENPVGSVSASVTPVAPSGPLSEIVSV
jgi:hypothetical protein